MCLSCDFWVAQKKASPDYKKRPVKGGLRTGIIRDRQLWVREGNAMIRKWVRF